MDNIKSVSCIEPRREGEYPTYASVGSDQVTRIEYVDENLGTYGIGWFMVYKGDFLALKINALAVEVVTYFEPEG